MDNPSPIALAIVVIGALMGFGRDAFTQFYAWVYRLWHKQAASPRLLAITRLYVIFTGMAFTVMGVLGLVGIVKF